MEDKEVKRKLRKVPDVDETGEPIWKIEGKREKGEKKRPNVISFPSKDRERRGR